MPEFKKGDLVRCTNVTGVNHGERYLGALATVKYDTTPNDPFLYAVWYNESHEPTRWNGEFYKHRFRLEKEPDEE